MATMRRGSQMTYRIEACYNQNIDRIRYEEYPMLKGIDKYLVLGTWILL